MLGLLGCSLASLASADLKVSKYVECLAIRLSRERVPSQSKLGGRLDPSVGLKAETFGCIPIPYVSSIHSTIAHFVFFIFFHYDILKHSFGSAFQNLASLALQLLQLHSGPSRNKLGWAVWLFLKVL